eukprot:7758193-Heterocapsa_arctica.AAC.2
MVLVNKGKGYGKEGAALHAKLDKTGVETIEELEIKVDEMRCQIKSERTNLWKSWVENSWDHKQKDIYKWIRGKKGNGLLIVTPGGSAQMKDRPKLAEETWGGLLVVEADELPKFDKHHMPLITEDEVRRVVNNLADGKAKGVDGWSPAELRALS